MSEVKHNRAHSRDLRRSNKNGFLIWFPTFPTFSQRTSDGAAATFIETLTQLRMKCARFAREGKKLSADTPPHRQETVRKDMNQ